MVRPFDPTKFRKSATKGIKGMSVGFNDPIDWISTGSYALNFLISGDFNKGIPLGKVSVFAGESGSGKSFLVSGNIVRDAQSQGCHVVLIDSENALDETWLHALGVDTSEEKLTKVNMAMIDDVASLISNYVTGYRMEFADVPREERPKILFVIDSLGMLLTPTEVNQFEKGDMKGDMGRKAKQLKALVTNCVNMFGDLNLGLVVTNHTYSSQDMFDPDDKISGGAGFIFASSIVVAMKKRKLKLDNEGNKTSTVNGIRSACKVVKSRYSKPFEDIELAIPYESGLDLYTGLLDLFEKRGLITKQGNRLRYVDIDTGVEHVEFRKKWITGMRDVFDTIMAQYKRHPTITGVDTETVQDDDTTFEEE